MRATAQLYSNPKSNNYWRWQNYCWRMLYPLWPPEWPATYMVTKTEKRRKWLHYCRNEFLRTKYLGDIREHEMQGLAFKCYHLTNIKYLSNISRAFHLGKVERSENDQDSVRAWIQEWQEIENNPYCFTSCRGSKPQKISIYFRKTSS